MFRSVSDKDVKDYFVIDLNKKEVIRGVQWANDETGIYAKFKFNKKREVIRKYCKITQSFESVIEKKKGNIIFVKTNKKIRRKNESENYKTRIIQFIEYV